MMYARRKGLGLVEMLVALSISAALLVAVGAALDTSFKAYRANQEVADLTQRARLGMHRMLTELRTTTDPVPADEVLAAYRAGQVVTTRAVRIDAPDGLTAIRYLHSGNQLRRQTLTRVGGAGTVASEGVFLDGVSAADFEVTLEPQRSPRAARGGLSHDQLRRATVRMTVRPSAESDSPTEGQGNQAVTLVSSVVPRRNAW
jgi:prepilin-type N-terminal cleavage/methylation domain-containing protein